MRVVSSSRSIENDQNSQKFWWFGPHFVPHEDPPPTKKRKRKRRTKPPISKKKMQISTEKTQIARDGLLIGNRGGKEEPSLSSKKKDAKKREEKSSSKERWTLDRYSKAELKVMDVVREKIGDVAWKRIARRELREEARKHIGDTGLLDHLLKHMAGKVVGSSGKRLMRGYTNDGVMEYWIEPAELAEDRKEGEGQDFGNVGRCDEEINELRETIKSLNRDMEELRSLRELEINAWKENYEKLLKKNTKLESEIVEINIFVQGLKEKYDRLMKRNIKLETKIGVMNGSLQGKEELSREEKKEGKATEADMIEDDKSECDNGAGHKKTESKQLHLSMPPKNFCSPQLQKTYLQIPCQRRVYVKCLNGSQKSVNNVS